MINLTDYQNRIDNSNDTYPIIKELFLEIKENNLNYQLSVNIYNFFKKNYNAHFNFVTNKDKNDKEEKKNKIKECEEIALNFNNNDLFENRLKYICILLDNEYYKIENILTDNKDVVDFINQKSETYEKPKIVGLPQCMCHSNFLCYDIEYKEGEDYTYKLHYEPYLNYIEFKLYKDDEFYGLVDDINFIKNFIYDNI